MKSRIIIIKKIETKVNNRPIKDDIDFYTCWADILDLIGSELYQAINIKLENTVVFKVRYCNLLKELRNKEQFKVKFEDKIYSIYQVDFMGNSKQFIKIKCKLVS